MDRDDNDAHRMKTLSRADAKAFYDRFGAKQDSQAFYEDRALADLIQHAAFETACHVLEFGCGTGRFAERILRSHLPGSAEYDALDISTTMVGLATKRLAAFGPRVRVRETNGTSPFAGLEGRVDRVVTTYVLDLLPREEISALIAGAAAALIPGGKLCMVSLTSGAGPLSRVVSGAWKILFNLSPGLVGGCRPIRVREYLSKRAWQLSHHATITAWGVTSEVVVADRLAG